MKKQHTGVRCPDGAEVQSTSVLDGLMLLADMEEEAERLRTTAPSRAKSGGDDAPTPETDKPTPTP